MQIAAAIGAAPSVTRNTGGPAVAAKRVARRGTATMLGLAVDVACVKSRGVSTKRSTH